uniref:Uncharacterized protein n=1 Tax=Anguilla anguilla TaxID=7936 RepID=A0A0E9QTM0_ANGAN
MIAMVLMTLSVFLKLTCLSCRKPAKARRCNLTAFTLKRSRRRRVTKTLEWSG